MKAQQHAFNRDSECRFYARKENAGRWEIRNQEKKRYYTKLQCLEIESTKLPSGSTDLARLRASDVAKSVLAGVTAKMRHVSLQMNCMSMSLIWASMSAGWSPTGTLVSPGRSIRVMLSTVQHQKQQVGVK